MKAALALGLALAAAPLAAKAPWKPLRGVADRETTIPYGDIQQTERGHGDVLFVRDRTDRWYRLQLNRGCLRGPVDLDRVIFRHHGVGGEIDRFTMVELPRDLRSCAITSMRRSAPPPQVDRRSPVTLD